jgi:hypothetical protein
MVDIKKIDGAIGCEVYVGPVITFPLGYSNQQSGFPILLEKLPDFYDIDGTRYGLVLSSIKSTKDVAVSVDFIARYDNARVTSLPSILLKQSNMISTLGPEARALELLNGYGISPKIFAFGSQIRSSADQLCGTLGNDYTLVEYISGPSLKDLFGTLNNGQVVTIGKNLIEMAKISHEFGLTIMDWKYEDIILHNSTKVINVDFGFSKFKEGGETEWVDHVRKDIRTLASFMYGIFLQTEFVGHRGLIDYERGVPLSQIDLKEIQQTMDNSCFGSFHALEPLLGFEDGDEQLIINESLRRISGL